MFLTKQYLIRLKRRNKFTAEFKNRTEFAQWMPGYSSEFGFTFDGLLVGAKRQLHIARPQNEEFPQLSETDDESSSGEANCWIHVTIAAVQEYGEVEQRILP